MRRLLPLVLLLVCFLAACKSEQKPQESAQTKIYVLDTARVFRESEPGKSGVAFLQSLQGEMQQMFVDLQAKLQADPENMEVQQEAQMVFGQLQQRMNAEEQNVMNALNDMILRVLDEYRTKNNIALILGAETIHAYDKSLDITDDIIAAVNKEKIEFKAVMPMTKADDADAQKNDAQKNDAQKADSKEDPKKESDNDGAGKQDAAKSDTKTSDVAKTPSTPAADTAKADEAKPAAPKADQAKTDAAKSDETKPATPQASEEDKKAQSESSSKAE